MSNLEFAVGKRVVCISAFVGRGRLSAEPHPGPYPLKGVVYTIRDLYIADDNEVYLRLAEFRRPIHPRTGREYGLWSRRFRPVRETSIDCFTALLEKPPVRQTEDA